MGSWCSQAQTIRDVIAEGVLADEVGVDFFGVGEHHRADFAVSSPEMVLASIASRTEKIRLGSAVTVLSSDDPVRVYQRFATLDAASNGRAEVILGRGSFTESFPLFGFDLAHYDELFEEKLNLFVELMKEQEVTWSGSTRASLAGPANLPDHRVGFRQGLGWGWREPGVRGESSALRTPPGACHHRRRPASIRSLRRPVPPSPLGVRTRGTADRHSLPGLRGRERRAGA